MFSLKHVGNASILIPHDTIHARHTPDNIMAAVVVLTSSAGIGGGGGNGGDGGSAGDAKAR